MLRFGYQLSAEQYGPRTLLDFSVAVEKAGFDDIWCSDHFHPWFHTNASASFAWTLMAAAAERTKHVRIGSAVTCPLFRYHPAIVAQAFASMGVVYPGRIFLGLGTGEAMNEIPIGLEWPNFKERAERLREAIKIMKLLWSEGFVNFKGHYYQLRKANLYTKPPTRIPLYVAANGPTVAEIAGEYADGFLTIPFPQSHYVDVLFPALERGARQAGRECKEIEKAVEIYVSYDEDYGRALASIRCWAGTSLPFLFNYPIYDPREIESYGRLVGDEQLARIWCVGTSPEQHIRRIEEHIRLGFENIHISSSSPDEFETINMYAKHVLPYLRSSYAESLS